MATDDVGPCGAHAFFPYAMLTLLAGSPGPLIHVPESRHIVVRSAGQPVELFVDKVVGSGILLVDFGPVAAGFGPIYFHGQISRRLDE